MTLIEKIGLDVKAKYPTIVFPEGEDERVLEAAAKLENDKVLKPVVLGKLDEIKETAEKNNIDISALTIIDPAKAEDLDEMVAAYAERRKGKKDESQAAQIVLDPNYYGTMLVYTGKADGMVSGACHTTGDTVKPALKIIKTKPGFSRTSGAFLMLRDDEKYLMADCAINIELDEDGLAEVAAISNETAKLFGIDPRVAMLSFSTKGSAKHDLVTKVANATEKAKKLNPDMKLDGELQFDAAFVPAVAAKKAPGSEVAGNANVFIFPGIEAGNIGYKIAQRFGGFEAVGPILQGLNSPVNDLSRGCNADEVYSLAIITAAQAVL